jgi:[acyl-carrier-protein] S-malonyltransferase
VVAGTHQALDAFTELCKERDISVPIPLKVSVAPHTSLMKAALPGFLHTLSKTPLQAPAVPVIGNVSADWLTTQEQIRDELDQQLTSTVRWSESMRRLAEHNVGKVVEVGPGKVLTGLMRRIDKSIKRSNFGAESQDLLSVIDLVTQQ